MTTHEYAKLLLVLENVPFYITESKEYYFDPMPPEIVYGPDPYQLIDKENEFLTKYTEKEKREGLDIYKREEAIEQQKKLLETTLPKTRYAIVEISIYM